MNQNTAHSGCKEEECMNEIKVLRRKCRKRLATHIKETTGITVEPAKVRLITKQSDCYTWCYMREVAHLFSKNFSDHGMAAYKELYDGVGKCFHTVSFAGTNSIRSAEPAGRCSPLSLEDCHRNEPLKKQVMEKVTENECLQIELQKKNEECDRLTQQLTEESKRAALNESLLFKCLTTLNQVESSIERVQQECSDIMDFTAFTD
ncbi:hypothetical protein BKA56DRAFT_477090 [Ilyonectria sp. MPI-CAGE-AT-0026]|nr:hypothetical protein BKA56DRAFT_477090 [Ilyonectria sp. MPI-CAGE-AT-0026]